MSLVKETNYKSDNVNMPHYRYARIPLNNLPSGAVAWQPTSETLLEWRVPANTVFNLSKSYISIGSMSLPALAGSYGVSYEDGFPFRRCQFSNGSGLNIVDIQYADCWVNTELPYRTKFEDFKQNDQLEALYPSRQLQTSNIVPMSLDGLTAGTVNATSVPYDEKQYLRFSTGVNTALNLSKLVPLSAVCDSNFDQPQDQIFGTDMYIRMWSNYLQRMFFYTDTPASPNNGTNTAVTASITATNVYLYLAIEQNLDIVNNMVTSLAGGRIRYNILWPYVYRVSSASTATNASLVWTKNYGKGVKRMTIVPYNANETTACYAYDHSNVNGTKVSQFQVAIDGRPLTDQLVYNYNPNSSVNPPVAGGQLWNSPQQFADDWREMRAQINQSCVLGYPMFQTNWKYSVQWGMKSGDNDYPLSDAQIFDYFDLLQSGDHTMSLQGQTPTYGVAGNSITNGVITYIMMLYTRTLHVLPNGIELGL